MAPCPVRKADMIDWQTLLEVDTAFVQVVSVIYMASSLNQRNNQFRNRTLYHVRGGRV